MAKNIASTYNIPMVSTWEMYAIIASSKLAKIHSIVIYVLPINGR